MLGDKSGITDKSVSGLFGGLIDSTTLSISNDKLGTTDANMETGTADTKEVKKKRRKKSGDWFRLTQKQNLASKNKEYNLTLKYIHPDLMLKAQCTQIIVVDDISGDEEKTYLTSEDESWEELVLFLLGTLHFIDNTDFESKLALYGVLNNSVQITKELGIVSDKDSSSLKVYILPGTDYLVKIHFRQTDVYNTILHCVEALKFNLSKFKLAVIQRDETEKTKAARGKAARGKAVKRKNSEEGVTLTSSYSTYTLDKILEPREIIPGRIVRVGVYGEELGVSGLNQSLGYILSFFAAIEPEQAKESMQTHTIADKIGVVTDQQEYIGQMKVTSIPNTELYYFTNGQSNEVYRYIAKVANDINIALNEIAFTYEELRIGEWDKRFEGGGDY